MAELEDEQQWKTRFAATTDDQWNQMAAIVRQEIAKYETVPPTDHPSGEVPQWEANELLVRVGGY